MLLTILGIAVIIIATYQVYKTAKDNGRNAVVWALITLVLGFGIQIVLPIIIVIVLGIVWMMSGTSELELRAALDTPATIISIVCLLLSFIAIALVIRQVAQIPEEKSFVAPPSPPNDFNQNS